MEMMLLSFLLPKLKRDWNLDRPEDGLIGSVVFLGKLSLHFGCVCMCARLRTVIWQFRNFAILEREKKNNKKNKNKK